MEDNIPDNIPAAGGAAIVPATLVVAASDSLDPSRADYICDGVADEVQINQAYSDLPAAGGKVVLLEGNFSINAPITPLSNSVLKGNGLGNTILTLAASSNMINIIHKSNVAIKDLTVDGSTYTTEVIALDDSPYVLIERCEIKKLNATGQPLDSTLSDTKQPGLIVKDCIISNSSLWADLTCLLAPMFINNKLSGGGEGGSIYTKVEGAIFIGNLYSGALHLADYSDGHHIVSNNFFNNGYVRLNTDYCEIVGNFIKNTGGYGIEMSATGEHNVIANNTIFDAGGEAILLGGSRNLVEGNQIYDSDRGILMGGGKNIIKGNWLYYNHKGGILINSDDNIIIGNYLNHNSDSSANTYDGIRLYAGATRNIVEGNRCGSSPEDQKYGINEVDATADYNIITGNICKYNVTDQIRIQGSHTIAYNKHSDLFMDVLAVSATHVVNAQACHVDPTTLTVGAGIAAQPDVPRTLSWVVNNAGGITAADIAITGIDAKGNSISEAFDLTGGLTGETNNAFATVSEVKIENQVNAAVGDTISVGITDVLGLSNIIYATGDVFKIKKNNADAVVVAAQVNTTYDTYDMVAIGLAATNDFTIWYKSNLNIIS